MNNSSRGISKYPLHTIFFAAFPVLALLANNISEIAFVGALRALILSIGLSVILVIIIQLALKDWTKTGLIVSGLIILFFTYGHTYSFLEYGEISNSINLGRHRILLPIWGLLALIWSWWVVKKLQKTGELARFFNFLGVLLVVMPSFNILVTQFQANDFLRSRSDEFIVDNLSSEGDLPDIYYIVLDGYGSKDVLEELYGYDNQPFVNSLQERDFYVAEESNSNYNQTALSLASSLNLKYVNELTKSLGENSQNRNRLEKMIKHSQVRDVLSANGYQIIAIDSGYQSTNIKEADIYWTSENEEIFQEKLNGFEILLLETTMGRVLLDVPSISPIDLRENLTGSEYSNHRQKIRYAIEKIDDAANLPGNYFVFAHILTPHPPFIFGPDGEDVVPNRSYHIGDGNHFEGDLDEYLNGYPDQVTFINQQMEIMIDRILENSEVPPIIIIQGDHGPGAYLKWGSVEKSNLNERFGILNAYYFPGDDQGWLYPSITPVNSFRVMFNRYFEGEYPLLEDESFFSTWRKPYQFISVTEEINSVISN
jgi:hypothetical protein